MNLIAHFVLAALKNYLRHGETNTARKWQEAIYRNFPFSATRQCSSAEVSALDLHILNARYPIMHTPDSVHRVMMRKADSSAQSRM
jgi:hypothetical protein